jgi:hypothetical protein
MFERSLLAVRTDDPGPQAASVTRERLKARFAPGAARRMTLPGMLVGHLLQELAPTTDDTVIYSSVYGESAALESYLASFPTPSPTLFQTSIHPSGLQQGLIGRQQPVRELFPMTGGADLPVQAALAAMVSPAPRVLWCGGDERATWMSEQGVASARTFAFALALGSVESAGAIGRLRLEPSDAAGRLDLADWFDLLHRRQSWSGPAATGWKLTLTWA